MWRQYAQGKGRDAGNGAPESGSQADSAFSTPLLQGQGGTPSTMDDTRYNPVSHWQPLNAKGPVVLFMKADGDQERDQNPAQPLSRLDSGSTECMARSGSLPDDYVPLIADPREAWQSQSCKLLLWMFWSAICLVAFCYFDNGTYFFAPAQASAALSLAAAAINVVMPCYTHLPFETCVKAVYALGLLACVMDLVMAFMGDGVLLLLALDCDELPLGGSSGGTAACRNVWGYLFCITTLLGVHAYQAMACSQWARHVLSLAAASSAQQAAAGGEEAA